MIEEPSQRVDPWNAIWRVAVSDALLVAALLGLALCLVVLLLIPQRPQLTSDVGPWRAQMQTRFGAAMEAMDALGLFTLSRSPIFRAVLAVLAFSLLIRTVERAEALWRGRRVAEPDQVWRPVAVDSMEGVYEKLKQKGLRLREAEGEIVQADRWPAAGALGVTAHAGPLVILLGLLMSAAWGWQVDNIVAQAGEEATIAEHGSVIVPESGPETWTDDAGTRLYVEAAGPEVTLSAVDADGASLDLLQRPDADPVQEIQFRLSDMQSVPYFAIPETEWLVRVAPQPGATLATDMPLIVQVLRLRTGELIAETVIRGDTVLTHDATNLQIERSSYLILSAVSDPGYWPKLVGLILTGLGLLGWAVWPARRLWIRQGEDGPVAAGDVPAGLIDAGNEARSIRPATALRLLTGMLGLVTSGWAAWTLARDGVIWRGSPVQFGLIGAWLVTSVAYFIVRAISDRGGIEEGEEG